MVWWKTWQAQYNRDNSNVMSKGGQLGSFMFDMTKFEYEKELDSLAIREAMEKAKKEAEAAAGGGSGGGGSGGGSGGGGSGNGGGAPSVDRVVNVYIGNSMAYSVPTNSTGQQNLEALAREVLRILELQRAQIGI